MEKQTLAERTAKLMSELGLDQVQLAKLARVTKSAVNQWKGSKPGATMKPEPAYAIADATDYEPRWLMIGEGPEKKQGDKRKIALSTLFDKADEKGKTMIFRVAEMQQLTEEEASGERNGSTG